MRARLKGVLAVAAVAATVAGASGCSSSDGAKGRGRPADGPLVEQDNTSHPEQKVQLKNAQYVKIAGLPDAAAAKRLDQALRSPLDWAVQWAGATLLKEQRAECGGRSSVIQTNVRMGLRGEVVSVANAIQMVPCYDGEGGLPTVPVTVDLKAGKVLEPEDLFTSKTLGEDGLKKLFDRLSGPKDDWTDCELEVPQRKDFSAGKRDGDPIESPAPAGVLFTPQGMELIWSTTGTDCNNFTFTAPYSKVKDLIKPEIYPRLLAAAGAK
ncbi:hypothetical protein [Spirillospora sp. NBC_01491]|uniref:hypothetical protein n=1 Tax=Spirillospora sp. NBC_01491 TaxID=2976007 RepID=UPI002E3560B3|nr:hypothetical protein [Spirillospora sp. NBC_01491]